MLVFSFPFINRNSFIVRRICKLCLFVLFLWSKTRTHRVNQLLVGNQEGRETKNDTDTQVHNQLDGIGTDGWENSKGDNSTESTNNGEDGQHQSDVVADVRHGWIGGRQKDCHDETKTRRNCTPRIKERTACWNNVPQKDFTQSRRKGLVRRDGRWKRHNGAHHNHTAEKGWRTGKRDLLT